VSGPTALGLSAFKRTFRDLKASYASEDVADAVDQYEYINDIMVLCMDVRTERDPNADTDDAAKDMMSAAQFARWDYAANTLAPAAGAKVLIHLADMNIMGAAVAGQDDMRGFTTWRTKWMDALIAGGTNLKSIFGCGDGHWWLLNQGVTNTQFGTGGTGGLMAVAEASPMDQFRVTYPAAIANTDGGGNTTTASAPYNGLIVEFNSHVVSGATATVDLAIIQVTAAGAVSTVDSMTGIAVP